jgi:hypothetical protein
MHRCTRSCYKYSKVSDQLVCRHNFPYAFHECSESECKIKRSHDKKRRLTTKFNPPRNNAFLNRTFFDPLLALAHNGNQDGQLLTNTHGAAEYVASYISKQETPDFQIIANNFLYKKLAFCENDFHRLKAVGQALLDSTTV